MLWRRFCVNRSDIDKLNYKLYKKNINTRNRLSTHFEKTVICSRNLGVFYKHINSRMNDRAGVAPLSDPQSNIVIDNVDTANLLNSTFVSVGKFNNGVIPILKRSVPLGTSFDSFKFDFIMFLIF